MELLGEFEFPVVEGLHLEPFLLVLKEHRVVHLDF